MGHLGTLSSFTRRDHFFYPENLNEKRHNRKKFYQARESTINSTFLSYKDVQPGDLVLIKTPGLPYKVGRFLMGTTYDHISVVVRNGLTANVVWPQNIYFPAKQLLAPKRKPFVIRPIWENATEQNQFVDWMESLMGQSYNTRRARHLILRLILNKFLAVIHPMKRLEANKEQCLCTDAVFHGLMLSIDSFKPLESYALDWTYLQCASTNDFLALCNLIPHKFQIIYPALRPNVSYH